MNSADPAQEDEVVRNHPDTTDLQQVWNAGPRGHIASNFDLKHERGGMQIVLKQDISSRAEKMNIQIACLNHKIKSVFDFITSLPPVFHSWALGRRKNSVAESEDLEADSLEVDALQPTPVDDAEATQGGKSTPVPPSPRPQGKKPGPRRRAAVVTLRNAESVEDARKKAAEAYFVEENRLQSSLTACVVKDICRHIYDHVVVESPPWNLRIGSVEAALIAWDLTSYIHGCCRIPMTMVTQREGRDYTFIFIVLMVDDHFALLGRYLLKDLCFSPLQRRKLSDLVDQIADILRLRGHNLMTLYLGLPTEGTSVPDDSPTFWRVLKLSCRRQEWNSVLASCDFYIARRQQVRSIISEVTFEDLDGESSNASVPTGLALWRNSRGEVRLKATEPLMVRQRLKRVQPKAKSCSQGGVAAIDKASVSALSMKMGHMEQKHEHEQELWHQLAFPPKHQEVATTSAFVAVEWPVVQESECSSVSCASLEECAEDFCIDRHQIQSTFS
ncbi:unnamed protein product, partial [Durusdinium trenchii]